MERVNERIIEEMVARARLEREFRVIGDKTWHRRNFYFPSFALIDNKAQPFLLFLSSNADFHGQRGLNQVSN